MNSEITLHRLRFHAYHGVLPQERIVGNDYEVTIVMHCDIMAAALSDDVADTINYAEAYQVVSDVMNTPCNLLERVAWLIADALLSRFPSLEAADVSVTKLNPPMGAHCDGAEVGIKVKRSPTPFPSPVGKESGNG